MSLAEQETARRIRNLARDIALFVTVAHDGDNLSGPIAQLITEALPSLTAPSAPAKRVDEPFSGQQDRQR
jgi:hypothetical protein